jgi:hypothetical protein
LGPDVALWSNGEFRLPMVVEGVRFADGDVITATPVEGAA